MAKRLALLGFALLLGLGGWALSRMGRGAGARSGTESVSTASSAPGGLEPLAAARPEPARIPVAVRASEEQEQRDEPAVPEGFLWYGRAVDGETQAPLGDAFVGFVEGDPFYADSECAWTPALADGTMELRLPGLEGSVVLVHCPGYALGLVAPTPGHEEPSKPQVAELLRAAALQVRVHDERLNATDPAAVEIRVKDWQLFTGSASRSFGHDDVTWDGQPGPGGSLVFEDLPPQVSLTLEALDGERSLHREELRLRPGERRELELSLMDGSRIAGRALTPEGEPVAGLEIWLVKEPSLLGYFDTSEDTHDRARTDEYGEFGFKDVAPGEWFVGPAAKDRRVEGGSAGEGEYTGPPVAPMPVVVKIQPGDGVVPVALTCWSGLYIRGHVIDSKGQAAANAQVTALAPGILCDCDVDSDGSFTAGPLIPGVYSLNADCLQGMDSRSDTVEARPGQVDVELHLRPGGGMAVTVNDEQGRPARGVRVKLVSSNGGAGGWSTWETDDHGQMDFRGVPTGLYALIATRGDSVAMRTDLTVQADTVREVTGLSLEPGAKLIIAPPKSGEPLGYRVRYGGWMLTTEGLHGGMEPSVVVPGGELEIELFRWNLEESAVLEPETVTVLERRTVTARAGESLRVEFISGDGEKR